MSYLRLQAPGIPICHYFQNRFRQPRPNPRASAMEAGGVDSEGRAFASAGEMWREEVGEAGDGSKKEEWYRQGVGYWEAVEASVDGVLGGYGHVNEADIKGSEAFLKQLMAERFPGGGRRQQQEEQLVALGVVSLPLDSCDSFVEAVV